MPTPSVRTFLSAEIPEYRRFTHLQGDEAAGQLGARFVELVGEVGRRHGAALQELWRNEALLAFDSAPQALRCAVALQRRLAAEAFEPGVAIGIESGEAEAVDGGYRGEARTLASRLCELAGPARVLAGEAAVELAGTVEGIRYGKRRLEPITTVEVIDADEEGTAPRRRRRLRRPRRRWLVLGGLLVVPLAAVVVALALAGRGEKQVIRPGVALLDAESGNVVAQIPVRDPAETIFAGGSFWVLNRKPLSFVEIDAKSRRIVRQIASPVRTVGHFAVDENDLWITDSDRPTLVKVDIASGQEVDRFRLADPGDTSGLAGVVVGAGSVWVTRPETGELVRLNRRTGEVQGRIEGRFASSVAFAEGDVWVASQRGLVRIDAATGAAVRSTQLAPPITHLVAEGGFAWAANDPNAIVHQVDRTGQVAATYRTGGARAVSYGAGALWIANRGAGTLIRVAASTGDRTDYDMGHLVDFVATGGGLAAVAVDVRRTFEDVVAGLEGRVDMARLVVRRYDFPNPDPAVARGLLALHIHHATCVKLLDYGMGEQSRELRPEVAAALPRLSSNGRTYTFTVRRGYRFSPPSNEPVTAETFRKSIERALSPRIGANGVGIEYMHDIVGAKAFNEGKVRHVAGLRAVGNRLSITLTRRSPDFLQRLALPFSCAVSSDAPAVPQPGIAPPSAGPYYITSRAQDEYLILGRNPNYSGPRPRVLDVIALREETDPARAAAAVESGTSDYAAFSDPVLGPNSRVARAHGTGAVRYYATPLPRIRYIAFNASRPVFANQRTRQAAAFALSRREIADVWHEVPADQYLPPPFGGLRQRGYYRLDADLARAKPLMRGARRTATMLLATGCALCRQSFESVRDALAPIGIDVEARLSADPGSEVLDPNAAVDLWESWTIQYYLDSASFLGKMLGKDVPAHWLPASTRRAVEGLDGLSGRRRQDAAAVLAARLARIDVPLAVVGYPVLGELFSPRLGCRVFPPAGYGVDLGALCPR